MASVTVEYGPLAGSELASAGIVLIPILVLFALLFVTRVIVAAIVGLAVLLIVSTQLYRVPAAQAFLAASNGLLFGAWPVCLIILAGGCSCRTLSDRGWACTEVLAATSSAVATPARIRPPVCPLPVQRSSCTTCAW